VRPVDPGPMLVSFFTRVILEQELKLKLLLSRICQSSTMHTLCTQSLSTERSAVQSSSSGAALSHHQHKVRGSSGGERADTVRIMRTQYLKLYFIIPNELVHNIGAARSTPRKKLQRVAPCLQL
jgi:hypothetical protein